MMKTPAFWSQRGAAAIALLPLTLLWRVGGALKAAMWAQGKKPGFYTMADVLGIGTS